MKHIAPLIAALAASPALAEGTRQMHAHEHGVGQLNIAVDGDELVMEFTAPGADIVGFEYEASSDADHAAIDAAVEVLEQPLTLFVPNAEAGCAIEHAHAGLEDEDDHDHDHEADHKDDHAHEGEHKDDHAHDDHAHDDHKDEHAHEGEHHDDEHEAHHTEFHAEYHLECADLGALKTIDFAYFDQFENAREVEAQIVTATGAQAFEVERDAPSLNVADLF